MRRREKETFVNTEGTDNGKDTQKSRTEKEGNGIAVRHTSVYDSMETAFESASAPLSQTVSDVNDERFRCREYRDPLVLHHNFEARGTIDSQNCTDSEISVCPSSYLSFTEAGGVNK